MNVYMRVCTCSCVGERLDGMGQGGFKMCKEPTPSDPVDLNGECNGSGGRDSYRDKKKVVRYSELLRKLI